MTTELDTNVLVALLKKDDSLNEIALQSLDAASSAGPLVVCGPVVAELMALPGLTRHMLDQLLSEARIEVDWIFDEPEWRAAGIAFAGYAARRRKDRSGTPRRILADFLIGAHAAVNGYSLLTLDDRLYRAAFPKLRLISV